VSVANGTVTHQSGSPGTVDNTGADLGLDPGRRRFYFGERIVGQPQKLHALDMDTLAPVSGSPVDIPGSSLGDLEVHPLTGDIFLVDYGDFELHSASAEPFALRNSCGTNGCSLPPTETGLALDHELDKLFIVHVPDLLNPDQGQGFMTAWDIADALNPLEITSGGTNGTRPQMSSYPIIATAM
jgi:hypothetical protein